MAYNFPEFKSASEITGATDGVNPDAGIIGHTISSGLMGPTGIANSTISSLTQVDLTPGNWTITGIGCAISTSAFSSFELGIGTTVNSYSGVSLGNRKFQTNSTGQVFSGIVSFDVSISVNTSYFLTFKCGFSAGTATIQGRISAKRN